MKKIIALIWTMAVLAGCSGSNAANAPSSADLSTSSLYQQLSAQKVVVKSAAALATETQKRAVLKMFLSMFNATPGADLLNVCADFLAGGMSESTLANLLAGTALFQIDSLYPNSLSNYDFSSKLLHNLVGLTVSEDNKKALATQLAALLDGGWKRGDLIWLLVNALAAVPASETTWGKAATHVTNKLEVSYYYSVVNALSSADLATLQAVVASVSTDAATVDAAKTVIDNTIKSAAAIQIGSGTGAAIKPLLGENAGPRAASVNVTAEFTTQYKAIGVNAIRTHDFLIYSSSVPSANPTLYPGPLDMSTMYFDRTKDPALPSSYNFTLSDQHFAAIINGGFEPFFRLGDSAGLTKPPLPSERPNWERAAIEVLKHYTQGQWNGYTAAIKEVEIWNEPDSPGFWNRSQNEFMSLYVETAAALRTAFPTLTIGGAGFTQGAVTSPTATGWLYTFLDQVKAANAPLDFISFHTYTNDAALPASLATGLRAILNSRGFSSTKIYITEWNTYANVMTDSTQAKAYRSGALGASTLTASWIKMQDAPVDRLFHYRGSDPNANTPEDYGLYTGSGVAKRTALAFQQWSLLAATQERLAASVSGNSNILSIAGKDSNGNAVILVVNTANAASTWIPTNASGQTLSGRWKLTTISDTSAGAEASTALFPVSIPAYGVQLLVANQ